MLPTPLLIKPDRLRVFLGMCDADNIGRVGYIDVDPEHPVRVLQVSASPVLDIGPPGSFDEHGVVPVSLLQEGDSIYLYYVGFQRRTDVPYTMFCGLAVSNDGGNTFSRIPTNPILPATLEEPFARCGVHVSRSGSQYRMWYIGSIGSGWTISESGKALPLYSMKTMTSEDLATWTEPFPETVLQFESADEHGFGRPFVWRDQNSHHMLYSFRTYSSGYKIGYAKSENGKEWVRKDEQAGLTPSGDGWESESLSYPYLFQSNDKTYVFYNGNGCGRTGIGAAELIGL